MSESHSTARLPKWPFYFADLVLSLVALYVLYSLGTIDGPWKATIAGICLAAAGWGAWISITPWLREHASRASLAESVNLKSSFEQLQNLESIATLIRNANSQWQGVQDASSRTVTAAQEIAERMKAETADFMNFIKNAHDQERTNLRLEVEKLRRMEGEWLKTCVQILDHIFAINQAAARSGQQHLIGQLQQFQNACRDVARKMGLVPFVPVALENFNPQAHQLPDAKYTPAADAKVGEVLAMGFTYQGQMLRRALVLLEHPEEAAERIQSGQDNTPERHLDEPLEETEPPEPASLDSDASLPRNSQSSQVQLPLA